MIHEFDRRGDAELVAQDPADASAPLDDNPFRSMRRLATLPAPGVFAPKGKIVVPHAADVAAALWDPGAGHWGLSSPPDATAPARFSERD